VSGRNSLPNSTPRISPTFPTSTMALNSPPLKLYDCANFALNNINDFAKGQGYAVSKFRPKTNAVGVDAEAARRRQVEVAAAKLVRTLPHKSPRNPIN